MLLRVRARLRGVLLRATAAHETERERVSSFTCRALAATRPKLRVNRSDVCVSSKLTGNGSAAVCGTAQALAPGVQSSAAAAEDAASEPAAHLRLVRCCCIRANRLSQRSLGSCKRGTNSRVRARGRERWRSGARLQLKLTATARTLFGAVCATCVCVAPHERDKRHDSSGCE